MMPIIKYLFVVAVSITLTLVAAFFYIDQRSNRQTLVRPVTEAETQKRLEALAGKVVLITGAGGGIGTAFARRAQQLKMKVILTDVKNAAGEKLVEEIRSKGGDAVFILADLRFDNERKKLATEAIAAFGQVDVLINNAGYQYVAAPTVMDMKEVRDQYEVNFFAAVDLVRWLAPHMKQIGGGTIVNISSILGHLPILSSLSQNGLNSIYSSSKSAINTWSRVIERALVADNIRVRVISPAGVRTKFWQNSIGPGKAFAMDVAKQLWQVYDDADTIARDGFKGIVGDSLFIFPGNARNIYKIFEFKQEMTADKP